MAILRHVAILWLLTGIAYTKETIDEVECRDQKEACECDSTKDICHFQLKIEELQTFASYIVTSNGQEETRGVAGDTYYLTNTGFVPALPPPKKEYVLEYGKCWRESVPTVEDFRRNNCSVPMTVDGRTYRMYIAVNGQIPGPTLIVTENQKIRVDVYNSLTNEGVTIHWHGMHQKGKPFMDGVAFVSQAPITPGAVFQYRFDATPAGTHWYHSHLGAQRTDGLFGALIVRERNTDEITDKLGSFEDIPSQHTLTLLDFQREASLSLFTIIHPALGFYHNKPIGDVPRQSDTLYTPRTNGTDGVEVGPIPYWSGLINGKGRYNSSTYSLLSTFSVDRGKTYRFRLIGAQSLYAYKVEVVGHKLTVIATDGHFIEPVEVDYIIIHTGERYDFLLNATQDPDNYMIRAQTLEVKDTNIDPNDFVFHDHTAEAVLHYNSASAPDPNTLYGSVRQNEHTCTPQNLCTAINCPVKEFPRGLNIRCIQLNDLKALFPSKESELPTFPAKEVEFLNFGFAGNSFTSAINGRNFILPATPWQTYRGSFDNDRENRCEFKCPSNIDCPPCIHAIQIAKDGKEGSVMMVLSALETSGSSGSIFDYFSHPIHLHGHSFYVVHVGHGNYVNGRFSSSTSDIKCDSSHKCTWANGTIPDFFSNGRLNDTAIRKDTVIVPAGGYVVIAFRADNPGYWFMHCHMEAHLLEGMAVIIQEYPDNRQPPIPAGINDIGNFNWNKHEPPPWKTIAIVFMVFSALSIIGFFVIAVIVVALCCKRKSKKSDGGGDSRKKLLDSPK